MNLANVVMPLVDVLASDGLSWSDRVKCADALRNVLRHYRSMKDEQRGQILGAALSSQQRQP